MCCLQTGYSLSTVKMIALIYRVFVYRTVNFDIIKYLYDFL